MNCTTSPTCTRQRRQGQRHSQWPPQRHTPRPLSLQEAIEGLSQALSDLKVSLGSSQETAQASQSSGHIRPQQSPQSPAIAMPWLHDSTSAPSPQPDAAQEADWADDLWSCPWDELSVRELRMLLRCYPIDRQSLPAPIELLRRSELIEALSQLQEISP